MNLSDLSVSVSSEIVEDIAAIVSIDKGSVTASDFSVTTDGEKAPVAIAVTANTSADNINISNSNIIVDIPADADQSLVDKVTSDSSTALSYDAASAEELVEALSTYGMARLTTDITIKDTNGVYSFPAVNGSSVIDMNDHTLFLDITDNYSVPEGTSNTFRNGTLAIMDRKAYDPQYSWSSIAVGQGASLELNNVVYNTNWNGIMTAWDAAEINIIDSKLFGYGYYGVGTNAGNQATGIEINIIRSYIETGNTVSELGIPMNENIENLHEDRDGCAVFFNVAGKLKIEDSNIIGGAQAVMIRGAENATISGSILTGGNTSSSSTVFDTFRTSNWQGGNGVPYATLVVGNRNGDSYPSVTNCTVTDTEILVAEDSSNPRRTPIYMASYANHTADLTIDKSYEAGIISGEYFGQNCVLNGVTLSVDSSGNPDVE